MPKLFFCKILLIILVQLHTKAPKNIAVILNICLLYTSLIIGNNNLAEKIYQSILKNSYDTGQHVVGYIKINGGKDTLHEIVPCLSKLDDIGDIILKYYIEDIYIVLEPADYDKISNVLSIREIFNVNIYIYLLYTSCNCPKAKVAQSNMIEIDKICFTFIYFIF